ncbi:protein root UVB sensitive 4 isoform X2 [Punica granatum]|uniref:Protein root UVB sensitive 4 isoform X2 n=1 Tax=Punica granatum TaxID=22663 RepID=A0A218W2G9_PUNGR|nr:protein root UVB sensitive 4 isoform X2 [Punica granatum]OWM66312.1 hypothetical protein CDL15_Pgr013529 [Punica granatum]
MQSAFYAPRHFQPPRQPDKAHFDSQLPFSRNLKTHLKFPTFTNSLRAPLHFEPGEEEREVRKDSSPPGGPNSLVRLPVVVTRSSEVSRYVWDGTCLRLVSFGGVGGGGRAAAPFCLDDLGGGARRAARVCGAAVRDFFLPKQVSSNYVKYVKWKFLHRVFSSALQVLATQAMFRAIGIGYSRSLPSAAALNWVLKDGLGRLSRCIYTASLASAFDTNLKRVRFSTSVLFSLSVGLELLTPTFPQYFLLLASIANIAKQISLACYLATGSAVHRSFAIADNLGEVSAKAQIQSVCFDNVGLALAALLNMLFKNNQRLLAALLFAVYPIFTAIDLLGIYQGLKHVHLQTLTKGRLEIILNNWIDFGCVPLPAEVSNEEGIDIFNVKGKRVWPVRIGCLGTKVKIPELSMMTMRSISSKDYYFICLESYSRLNQSEKNILVCLREGAATSDIIAGLLQACYVRKTLLKNRTFWDRSLDSYASDAISKEWFRVTEDSRERAKKDLPMVSEQISAAGWAVKNVLLSTEEQLRYSFVDD